MGREDSEQSLTGELLESRTSKTLVGSGVCKSANLIQSSEAT